MHISTSCSSHHSRRKRSFERTGCHSQASCYTSHLPWEKTGESLLHQWKQKNSHAAKPFIWESGMDGHTWLIFRLLVTGVYWVIDSQEKWQFVRCGKDSCAAAGAG
ncbi:hypothetical protein UPYG_G00071630 [Umbra pygmaea]|uniref:Uncharacterized protein n=1 Tax=Umbra pygmaea TaxID=75934 RepID=A0ABD0XEW2_UMBPY